MSVSSWLNRIPATGWIKSYRRRQLPEDLIAGFITAVMLIPQGLAYAILAGLPPEVGLYASVLPPIIYAALGTSRTMSVGPVSVAALLVANALAASGNAGDGAYLADALLLALLSGMVMLAMAALRLDVLVNFIGHPVLSGFTSGAAVLIIFSQMGNLAGLPVPSTGSWTDFAAALLQHGGEFHRVTLMLGITAIGALLLMRMPMVAALQMLGMPINQAALVSKVGPLLVVTLLTLVVALLQLDRQGVAVVGEIPAGFPSPTFGFLQLDRVAALLPFAVIISLIGYVESVSVAKVLACRRREKIDNHQELIALGTANVAAAFSGGMPVAGSFSRSMVNFSAGAATQFAAVITAVLVGIAAAFFTHLFFYLPKAALAAVIVVSVLPLLDWRMAVKTFRYDVLDGSALLSTFLGVLLFDIETGLVLGVAVAIGGFVWRSSRPHVVIVGRMAGTEHFRNVNRYRVETWPNLLLLRVDRSLYFANVTHVEKTVADAITSKSDIEHLIILCSGVNDIDHSALEALEQLSGNLREAGVTLHLSEVKGPIMDRLGKTGFEESIKPGLIFISTQSAVAALAKEYSPTKK